MTELTPALIAMVLGAVISLIASYVPGFRTRWAGLASDAKQAIMGVAMIVIGIVVYVLACTPVFQFTVVACPAGGFWTLVGIIFGALTGNQLTDRVSPDTGDVKAIKAQKTG